MRRYIPILMSSLVLACSGNGSDQTANQTENQIVDLQTSELNSTITNDTNSENQNSDTASTTNSNNNINPDSDTNNNELIDGNDNDANGADTSNVGVDTGTDTDTDTGTDADTDTDTDTDTDADSNNADIVNTTPVERFSNAQVIYTGEATTVQWGDIDGDGDLDLFAAEGGKHRNGTPTLSWFEFPGWKKRDIGTPLTPFTGDSQVIDMDSDGDLDVVISVDSHSDANNTGIIYWYENIDPLSEAWPRHIIEENIPNAFHIGDIAVGDVDANGLNDVVVRHLSSYRFVVYFQIAKNRWQAKRITTRNREGLAIADLNNDGLLDIIGNGYALFAPSSPLTGTWQEVVIDPEFYNKRKYFLNNSVKVGTADIDGNGKIDVIISPAEGEAVYFAWYEVPDQPMTDNWEKHIIEAPLANNHQVQIADVDLDGDLDLLGGFAFGDAGVIWWENVDGKGSSFQRHTIHNSNGCYSCRVADFDGDGDYDFAGPTKYVGNIYLYENQSANHAGPFID